jgi:hypothetical protein
MHRQSLETDLQRLGKRISINSTKEEQVFINFSDAGLVLVNIVGPYVNNEEPILLLNNIGRTLWMNDVFQDVFLKGEKDLLEFFNPSFGFEVFEIARDVCFKQQPSRFEYKGLLFVMFCIFHFRKELMKKTENYLAI